MVTQLECFLLMGFGPKTLLMDYNKSENFDIIKFEIMQVVKNYEKTHPEVLFRVRRSDDFSGPDIPKEFYEQLYNAELVIAEISSISPNVYYELGVRFALRKHATILLAIENTPIPFDLYEVRKTFYKPGQLINKQHEVHKLMEDRLNGLVDSPIYEQLPNLRVIQQSEIYEMLRVETEKLQDELRQVKRELELVKIDAQVQFLIDEAQEKLTTGRQLDLVHATENFKLAYERVPANFLVTFEYGKLLLKNAEYDNAIPILRQAVELNHKSPQPLSEVPRELGLAFRRRGTRNNNMPDLELAKAYIKESLDINPDDDDAWGVLGGLHKRLDEITEAIECYQKGLSINSKSTYCLINELMLRTVYASHSPNITNNKVRLKRLQVIAQQLLGHVELNTINYWHLVNRAEWKLLVSEPNEAIEFYERAVISATTPDQLKSAMDNLEYINSYLGITEARVAFDLLRQRRDEMKN